RVLTDRVLRLLLAGAAPSSILALTFTRAAAAEMKSRVVESLVRWATAPRDELAAELQVLCGGSDEFTELEIARARRQLPRVLDEPGGIPIQTIHSYCQSLLGRFPVESGVAAHFQVMDERTAAEMQFDARNVLLARAGADTDLAREIETITERANEGQFGELMRALGGNRSRLRALLADGAEAAIDRLRAALDLAAGDSPEVLTAAASADGAFDADALRRAAKAMVDGGVRESGRGEAILDWLGSDAGLRAEKFGAYLGAFFKDGGNGDRLKESSLLTNATRAAMPDAEGVLIAETDRLEAVRQRFRAALTLSQTASLLRVADSLLTEIERNKERHALVDYDDLILKTAELLRRPGIGEWVRFKLDGGIDHFLIDEAQDTSPVQWEVVDLLTAEFFAGAGAREGPRTVFAVGDPKQSIYGFRHADPALFASWRERFRARVVAAEELWRTEDLVESFRTVPVILELVDKVFREPEARKGLLFDGGEIHHISRRQGQGGFIELWPVLAPQIAATQSAWDPARQNEQRASPSALLANRIAECVQGWVGKEMLPARNRPVRAGDVMVLVQRRTAFVPELIRAFKLRGIPVAGVDRMILTDQLPVADLMALARFALFPDDDLNLAVVLKGPFVGLTEDEVFDLAYGRSGRLWAALVARRDKSPAFAEAHRALAAHLARADTVPPHTFFAELLAAGGRLRLFARLGREADDPVDEFLASALEYEHSHPPSLQGFLRWIESGRTEIKREQEQGRDEVRVLTVHGAKGLQAPIVFLADTVWVPGLSDVLLWDQGESGDAMNLLWPRRTAEQDRVSRRAREAARDRSDEEYRRLLYVAMTRAEDRLVVCGWQTQKQQTRVKSWHRRISDAVQALGDPPED
ncbi:MAG: double-strand break repair helicase AddA, partial [Proteobacteria bacterium]|nr:double-strand break repair helicase AddA [Pseudomonadota bacterium]